MLGGIRNKGEKEKKRKKREEKRKELVLTFTPDKDYWIRLVTS